MEGAVILQMKSRFVVKWLIVYALRGNCERLWSLYEVLLRVCTCI